MLMLLDERSPLHVAVVDGDLDIFRLLLSRGANPNVASPRKNGETALAAASRLSLEIMFRELLDHGADPNQASSIAVVSAAAGGNIKAMLALINRGANIHEQEGVPGKALHLAARNLQTDMVKLLLKHGVDANSFGGRFG